MKKTFYIFIIFFFSQQVMAQYGWTKAEVYLKNGTVLKGEANLTMMYKTLNLIKEKVKFRASKKGKVSKYTPDKVDNIIFTIEYKEKEDGKEITKTKKAKYIPIFLNKKQTKLGFVELIVDGKLRLVGRTILVQSGGTLMLPNNPSVPHSTVRFTPIYLLDHNELMLVKNGEEPKVFNQFSLIKSFKNRAADYFKDCPSLQNKIKNKEFKKEDLETIVNYYNSSCN